MCCMWLWQNYVWNWSRKEEKGTWRNFQAFCWLSQFHCHHSLQDFTHIILQHRNTFVLKKKKKVLKDRLQSTTQPGVSCSLVKITPLSWGFVAQNAPRHKCRQQPNNIPTASLWGNTVWASERDEDSKRRVGPRGEQRENRSMAFAQSFDLSVAFPQGTGCWLSMKPQWVST